MIEHSNTITYSYIVCDKCFMQACTHSMEDFWMSAFVTMWAVTSHVIKISKGIPDGRVFIHQLS